MIIFIHGEDNYSSLQYLNRVIEKFKQKHDSNGKNVLVFNCSESEWESVANALTGAGFFSSKKLVILKNSFGNKDMREALNEFLNARDLDEDVSLVIYESSNPDKRSVLFKRLNKEKYIYEFLVLDARAVEKQIARMADEAGKKIEPSAARELAGICGSDLWRAKSEIGKLSSLSGSAITSKDIREHTRAKLDSDIWQFVDSISNSNKKQALNMLENQLESGEDPMYLLSMMIRQFRLLIALYQAQGSDSELAASMAIHPYVVKKTRQQAKQFTIEKLKAVYRALARMDSALKSSKGDPKVLFTVLIDSVAP